MNDYDPPTVTPGSGDWSAWTESMENLADYDFEAVQAQRDFDLKHVNDQP